jgi:hypothetical protein
LHFEANVDLFGHFFNPNISLNLDEFEMVPNNFASNSFVHPSYEVL